MVKHAKVSESLKLECSKAQLAAATANTKFCIAHKELDKLSKIFPNKNDRILSEYEKREILGRSIHSIVVKLFPWVGDRECTLEVMKFLTASNMFGKEAAEIATIKLACAYTMTVNFEPHLVLEEMDTNCEGTFNQGSMQHLYNIEDNGKGSVAYLHGHSLTTPVHSLTVARAYLDNFISFTVPVQRNENEDAKPQG